MPEINIEEKIQEALKRKSFKENKLEYLGLALIYCLMLFVTFVLGYFSPLLAIVLFIFADIPLMMGFKHFIWFGPASGETLMDGFRVSMICGYLNFVSYMKIFITSNIKALVWAFVSLISLTFGGSLILERVFKDEINALLTTYANGQYEEMIEALFANEALQKAMLTVSIVSIAISVLVYYFVKLNRALLPYVSFLRLTNLEGKSMEGVLAHTRKVLKDRRWSYYLKATVYHLFYLIPIGTSVGVFFLLGSNPVYSLTTVELMSALAFFITMFPAVLLVELNNRNFCIEAYQEFLKEHKKMLNAAMDDLNKNVKR